MNQSVPSPRSGGRSEHHRRAPQSCFAGRRDDSSGLARDIRCAMPQDAHNVVGGNVSPVVASRRVPVTTAQSVIVRSSLRDQVLVVLRQRLVSGQFEPGEIYSAQAVAAELGVSGSPVREAMLTLVNQGLMIPIRNRGFKIVEMSNKDRVDVFEMRLWLEVPAMTKLASQPDRVRPHESALREISATVVKAARVGDLAKFLDSDREFHLGLTEVLESTLLTAMIGDLRDRTRLFGLNKLVEQGTLASSAEEHIHILDAIVAGSISTTEQLMTAHVHHVVSDWAGS